MTISGMRAFIMAKYPNSMRWHEKVRNMPTRQVVAIYKRMSKDDFKVDVKDERYHQIDMFEYMAHLQKHHTEVVI